jgi:hypothetical protein
MSAELGHKIARGRKAPSTGGDSLQELFIRFPGLAATIAGYLDQNSKKNLRACSRACRDAVDPTLKGITVPAEHAAAMVYLPLLQNARWHHLQDLRLP